MGFNDHCYDRPLENKVKKCKYCGEYYTFEKEEQVPGFRDIDEEVCPYCNKTNNQSMEYEFSCYKLTRDEKEYLKQKGIIK